MRMHGFKLVCTCVCARVCVHVYAHVHANFEEMVPGKPNCLQLLTFELIWYPQYQPKMLNILYLTMWRQCAIRGDEGLRVNSRGWHTPIVVLDIIVAVAVHYHVKCPSIAVFGLHVHVPRS